MRRARLVPRCGWYGWLVLWTVLEILAVLGYEMWTKLLEFAPQLWRDLVLYQVFDRCFLGRFGIKCYFKLLRFEISI